MSMMNAKGAIRVSIAVFAVVAIGLGFAGLFIQPKDTTAGVEWCDPLPDLPGKFMGPHGPQHTDWHYHGPPQNEDAHCDALEDSDCPEEAHEACGDHH
jgi:hypothetical protein